MATIIKMPAPRARTDDTAALPGGATILFFTGVRYEREVEIEAHDAEEGAPGLAHTADDASVQVAL